jgi:endonuclease/exonuclease/phosphatase family metal-dependent hydrolase
LGPEWLAHPDFREPRIVCGDLNFRSRSPAYRLLAERLRDVSLESGRRPAATFPSRRPIVRIDYILIGGDFEVLSAEAARTALAVRASDHLPLIAELQLAIPVRTPLDSKARSHRAPQ